MQEHVYHSVTPVPVLPAVVNATGPSVCLMMPQGAHVMYCLYSGDTCSASRLAM